eukprot:gb/GECG01010769.1/.p1 GENE.gb/GECG01010769.1/~~gb/GECG01010769.1/.p1  ORF type:complete len:923 (+),score=131.40 gb/GECG01010769.1/:1-2769(+)
MKRQRTSTRKTASSVASTAGDPYAQPGAAAEEHFLNFSLTERSQLDGASAERVVSAAPTAPIREDNNASGGGFGDDAFDPLMPVSGEPGDMLQSATYQGSSVESRSTDEDTPAERGNSSASGNAKGRREQRQNRVRLPKACESCHARKRKCDGNQPCASCSAKGVECVYRSPKKRGPKQGSVQGLYGKLRKAQDELEASKKREMNLQRELEKEKKKSKAAFEGIRQHFKPPRAPPAYLGQALDWVYSSNTEGEGGEGANAAEGEASQVDPHAVSAMADLRRLAIALQLPHTTIVSTKVGWVCYTLCQSLGTEAEELQYVRAFFVFCNSLLPMVDPTYFCNILELLNRDSLKNSLKEQGLFENEGLGATARTTLEAQKIFRSSDTPIDHSMLTSAEELRRHGFTCSKFRQSRGGKKKETRSDTDEYGLPKHDHSSAKNLLKVPEHAEMPFDDEGPISFTRQTPAAASLLLNGVLAIGARLNMHHDRANIYAERARVCCVCGFDIPRLATVSGLLLLGYYRIGTSEKGDLSQAKLYVALANEMAHSIASKTVPRIDDERINSLDPPPSDFADSCEWASHPGPWHEESEYLPANVAMTCKVLAQITAVSRSLSFSASEEALMRGSSNNEEAPRIRMTRILNFVGRKLRRRISTPQELSQWGPLMAGALEEAEKLVKEYRIGAAMNYSFLIQIHACKATLYYTCGNNAAAEEECNAVLNALKSPFRLYGGYVDTASLVMLIPVLFSCQRSDEVSWILHLLQERAKIWPLAKLLVGKAKRRVEYCKQGSTTASAQSRSSQQREPMASTENPTFPSIPAQNMQNTQNLERLAVVSHSISDEEASDMHNFKAYVADGMPTSTGGLNMSHPSSTPQGPTAMGQSDNTSTRVPDPNSFFLNGDDGGPQFGIPDMPLLGMDFDDFFYQDSQL